MNAVLRGFAGFNAAALLLFLVSFSPAHAQSEHTPDYQPGTCPLEFASSGVECGVVIVPQDRAEPAGRSVSLAVAVFKAQTTAPRPDPVIFLDGGPGARTLDSFSGGLGGLLQQLNLTRDVIIFDYRGIGYSDPSLTCPEAVDATGEAWVAACRERFAAQGVDVTAYTTRDNAADAAAIVAALGYDSYNIWGGSYGSSVAMTLLRDRPENIRAAIVTALQPPQGDLQAATPVNVLRTLEAIDTLCQADAACAAAYPNDLTDMLAQVIQRLDANPLLLADLGLTGDLTGLDVLVAISEMLKDEANIPLIPGLIHALYAGQYDWLLPYAEVLTAVTLPPNNYGAWLSMRCTDSILATTEDALAEALTAIPVEFRAVFLDFHRQQVARCETWGARVPTAADRLPAVTDTPVLIISGALDPFSSTEWLDSTLATLPNAQGFMLPYHMHYVQHERCASRMLTGFIKDPTAALESDCLDDVPAPAFQLPAP